MSYSFFISFHSYLPEESSTGDHGNSQENFMKQFQHFVTPLLIIGLMVLSLNSAPREQAQVCVFLCAQFLLFPWLQENIHVFARCLLGIWKCEAIMSILPLWEMIFLHESLECPGLITRGIVWRIYETLRGLHFVVDIKLANVLNCKHVLVT